MVAVPDEIRARWEQERERREIAELELLAAWLLNLYGSMPTHR